MRIDKFLAESGVGRRKDARRFILDGDVEINNVVVCDPTWNVNSDIDEIFCRGVKICYIGKHYYMFNKPTGCVTARIDAENNTVFDYIKEEDRTGLFAVGRLDKDTEGLLFLTNDGEFDYVLMNPQNKVEKQYEFWALGSIDINAVKQIEKGVELFTNRKPKPSRIEIIEQGAYKNHRDEIKCLPCTAYQCNKENQQLVHGIITISEGQKHQVKRMLKAIGCYVVYLKRICIGDVYLDKKLKTGEYRRLTEEEIRKLITGRILIEENMYE